MRPTYPHTLADVVHAVDGFLGTVVGDLPDGSIWVLRRQRRTQVYTLVHYDSPARKTRLAEEEFADRRAAVNAMASAIGLHERL